MQGSYNGHVEKFKKDKRKVEEFEGRKDDRKNKIKRGRRPEDDIEGF